MHKEYIFMISINNGSDFITSVCECDCKSGIHQIAQPSDVYFAPLAMQIANLQLIGTTFKQKFSVHFSIVQSSGLLSRLSVSSTLHYVAVDSFIWFDNCESL